MEMTIVDLLYKALAKLHMEPKSRETSLAITKVDEAILWWKRAQQLEFEKQTGPASNG